MLKPKRVRKKIVEKVASPFSLKDILSDPGLADSATKEIEEGEINEITSILEQVIREPKF